MRNCLLKVHPVMSLFTVGTINFQKRSNSVVALSCDRFNRTKSRSCTNAVLVLVSLLRRYKLLRITWINMSSYSKLPEYSKARPVHFLSRDYRYISPTSRIQEQDFRKIFSIRLSTAPGKGHVRDTKLSTVCYIIWQ